MEPKITNGKWVGKQHNQIAMYGRVQVRKIWQVQQMHHSETTKPITMLHPNKTTSKIHKPSGIPPFSTSRSILEPSWVPLRRKNSLSSWNFWSAASLGRKIRANDFSGDFWVRGNGLLNWRCCQKDMTTCILSTLNHKWGISVDKGYIIWYWHS